MAKSIKKNFFYNILLNISSVIFPLITAPYVSRVLEPDGVGLNNFANTYAGYFALVALLGIPTYGVREVAKVRNDKADLSKLISELMSIATLATIVVSLLYITSIALVGQLTANYIIFLIAGFGIYLAPFKINWYYQGLEEFDYITLRSLVVRILSLFCLFIFVKNKSDLIIYVILNVTGGVVADIWNFTKMWKSGVQPTFTLKGLKPHIVPLFTLFASSVAISIYTVLDTLMLGFITNYDEVGYYTNAMHIIKVLLTLVTSLSIVAIPRFTYYINNGEYANANKLVNRSFSYVVFLAFPMCVGISCISTIFVPWFFGDQFIGAAIPMIIQSSLIIAIGFSNILGLQILVGIGKDDRFLRCILYGTISNIILNIVLIPSYGAIGASVASVVAEFLVTISMTYYVYKETPVRLTQKKDLLKSILGAILFIPIFLILPKWKNASLFISIYVFLCFFFFGLSQMLLHNSLMMEFVQIGRRKVNSLKNRLGSI